MTILKNNKPIEIANIFEEENEILLSTLVHFFFSFREKLKMQKKPNHAGNYCKLYEENNYMISIDEMEHIKDYAENDYAFIADSNASMASTTSQKIDYERYL